MNTSPIGVFDSGVGGLSVLRYAVNVLKNENFIFYGDSANAPYGEKSKEEVLCLASAAAEKLANMNIKALVIACNTATSVAVDYLRSKYPFPIISMEPAVKPALTLTTGKVLLMATEVTLASNRVNALINKYDTDGRVIKVPCPLLAKKIEQAVFEKDETQEYLSEILSPYGKINATSAVLGCTHYPFVEDKIKSILGDIPVFDGIDGTVEHLKCVLEEQGLRNQSSLKGKVELCSSKTDKRTLELYERLFTGGCL